MKSRIRDTAKCLLVAGVVLGSALTGSRALACSIPVFRYALERWPADPYEMQVFLPPGEEVPTWIEEMITPEDGAPANVFVRRMEAEEGAKPSFAVRFPRAPVEVPVIWKRELTRENAAQILDSPVREELAKRLQEGDSAVWLVLDSPDEKKNQKAMELLEKELKSLEENLRLPEDPAMPPPEEGAEAPEGTGISFSTIRIKRNDPKEAFLREVLLQTEPDLKEFLGEVMTFPVYGRGRALYALVAKGINPAIITEACAFLVGPCSCQVKALNPGVDLLIRADWEANLDPMSLYEDAFPPLSSVAPTPLTGGEPADAGPAEENASEAPVQPASALDETALPESEAPPGALGETASPKGQILFRTVAGIALAMIVVGVSGTLWLVLRG